MALWSDGVSEVTQNDIDSLVDRVLSLVLQELKDRRRFFPFVMTIDAEGEGGLHTIPFPPGASSTWVVSEYESILRKSRENLRASAIVHAVPFDGTAFTNTVELRLEHRENFAMMLHLPYRARLFRRPALLGEMTAVSADRAWAV
jgi:hypothetical protein